MPSPKFKPASELLDIPHEHREKLARLFCALYREPNGCILWPQHRDRKGYGQVRIGKRIYWAHRAFYALFKGPIPEGQTVHHTCANSGCINYQHFELATVAENTREGNARRKKDKKDLPVKPADDIPF